MSDVEKNYYEILETPFDSSFEDIEKSYTKAKNAYSTDSLALYSLMSDQDCKRMLDTIDEAYSILSDADKRRQYDEARGIKNRLPANLSEENVVAGHPVSEHKASLNKMIAKNIFALTFERDEDIEREIEQTSSFTGSFLKKIREYKNVDLQRMSEITKISKTYIRYIEDENFENLPASVYVRGFVYQYAKCLKLSPDTVAKSYLEHMKELRQK